jgi:hypothetical protein
MLTHRAMAYAKLNVVRQRVRYPALVAAPFVLSFSPCTVVFQLFDSAVSVNIGSASERQQQHARAHS